MFSQTADPFARAHPPSASAHRRYFRRQIHLPALLWRCIWRCWLDRNDCTASSAG